ncbi:uncharacterized protein LOC9651139 [Selaginella moellendorffii]|nr:uncharacterized protein LOC9651139 [Selaginella moellendorffii]|eukprot:XP_002983469.2 uncharacterized protein LOC9651139 [Selaginella moellendorffii]
MRALLVLKPLLLSSCQVSRFCARVPHSRRSAMASGSCAGLAANSAAATSAIALSQSARAIPDHQAALSPLQDFDSSANAIILEPVREGGQDVAIVFASGALTPASDYIPLCQEIQRSCELRMWIAIVNPPNNVISQEIIEQSLDGILERMKDRGFRPGQLAMDNIFIAGHSWGAWTGRAVAVGRAQGFIQIGSCFHTNPDNLSQYPKPVLTLSGELDGQITLGAIAKHAGEIFDVEEEMGSFNTYGRKPVVVIPGMNHAQVSHGVPNKARGDLDAEIPIEQARTDVGRLIAAFVTVHAAPESASALLELEKAVKNTHETCRSYWEAIKEQGSSGVKNYQLDLAKVSPQVLSEGQVSVIQHDYEDNFVYSKPWIEHKPARKVFVNTYLKSQDNFQVVRSLWIKMKSREAITTAFKAADDQKDDAASSPSSRIAAGFNERTFQEALKLVPERARAKFLDRGRKPRFVDDLVISDSAPKWIKSDVTLVAAEDGFADVQSPVLISPMEMPPRFAGMHYMKLLTIAGAMKWIFTDCYRTT